MIDIGKADIIIYNGGETEGWASQVLEAASNKNIIAEKMIDYIETVTEEDVTGLQCCTVFSTSCKSNCKT